MRLQHLNGNGFREKYQIKNIVYNLMTFKDVFENYKDD